MLVIPGSHRRNTLPRPDRPELGFPHPDGAVEVRAAPGTACVFDRRIWHGRSPNLSAITRKVVFLGFTYRWIRPRHEHVPDLHAGLDPRQRQLLGASASQLGYWIPDERDVPLRGWMREHGLMTPPILHIADRGDYLARSRRSRTSSRCASWLVELRERLELLQARLAALRIVRAKRRGHDLLEQARLALDRRSERLQVPGGDAVAGQPLADDHDLDVGAVVGGVRLAGVAVDELELLQLAHEGRIGVRGAQQLVERRAGPPPRRPAAAGGRCRPPSGPARSPAG